ncbi:MAG: RT0821/Lpp0805 family surface protein [Pseudomonadota bacterium]
MATHSHPREAMIRRTVSMFLCISCLLVSHNATAMWGWLRQAAVTEFSEADWDLLKATARQTLESGADGEQVNWRNEDSGNKGAVKVIMSFQYDSRPCRRMAFLNVNNKGVRGVANYNLCKSAGVWEFVTDSDVTGH